MLHFLLTIMVGLADLFLATIALLVLSAIVLTVLGTARVRRFIRSQKKQRVRRFVP